MQRKTARFTRVAGFFVAVANMLVTPWGAAMTTAAGLLASASLWLASPGNVSYWVGSILIFAGVIWSAAGIAWLGTRGQPTITKPHQDYRYSLTFEGLHPNYTPDDLERTLGFRMDLRNFSGGPLRYVVREYDVRLGKRALPRIKKGHLQGLMARGAGRTSSTDPFSAEDIKDLIGKVTHGTVDIVVDYGPPDGPFVSTLTLGFDIVLDLTRGNGVPAWGANIREERDTPVA